MMKDQHDSTTGDLLSLAKRRGRPPKDGPVFSNTDKTIRRRQKIKTEIAHIAPEKWSIAACCEVMAAKKHAHLHHAAWQRYAVLKEFHG